VTCREMVELVTAYLEGHLDSDARSRFEEHLAICDGCQAYVEEMRDTLRALGRLPEERLSPQARDTLLAAFGDWHVTTSGDQTPDRP
jgi:anti-sigma factor RsiW